MHDYSKIDIESKAVSEIEIESNGDETFVNPKLEFFRKRLGRICCSDLHKFIKISSDKVSLSKSKTADDYFYRLAWERSLSPDALDGGEDSLISRLDFGGKAIDHGNDHEQEAKEYFEKKYNVKIISPGNINNGVLYGTPDGEIDGANKLVEIKCPYSPSNLFRAMDYDMPYEPKHLIQCYGYLALGRHSCLVLSQYDPHVKGEKSKEVEVKFSEQICGSVLSLVNEANTIVNNIVKKYEQRQRK